MRAKIAVFLTAAVVFAPAWSSDGGAARTGPSSDVAARMLAPTFDEAPDTTTGGIRKRSDRASPRTDVKKIISWVPALPIPELRGLIVAALIAIAVITAAELRRVRSGRAPPRLLTV